MKSPVKKKIAYYQIPVALLGHHRDDITPAQFAAWIGLYCGTRMARDTWNKVVAQVMEYYAYDRDKAEEEMFRCGRETVAGMRRDDVPDLVYADSHHDRQRSVLQAMGWNDFTDETLEEYRQLVADVMIPETPFAVVGESVVADLKSGAWSPSLFVTYAAIVSMIGGRQVPKVLRYDALRRRADGFTKATAPPDYTPSLTVATIRRRIETLEARGMIRTYSTGHTRERLYWIPSKIGESKAMDYIVERAVKRRRAATNRDVERDVVEAAVSERLAADSRLIADYLAADSRLIADSKAADTRQQSGSKAAAKSISVKHPEEASPESIADKQIEEAFLNSITVKHPSKASPFNGIDLRSTAAAEEDRF